MPRWSGCQPTTSWWPRWSLSVAEVWGPVSEELHVMQETLSGLDGEGAGELVTSPNELRATRQAVDEAMLTARDDPLGLSRPSVTDLEVRVARLAAAHEEAARGSGGLDARAP